MTMTNAVDISIQAVSPVSIWPPSAAAATPGNAARSVAAATPPNTSRRLFIAGHALHAPRTR